MGVFKRKGLKVSHNKNTSGRKAVRMERCQSVTLPMKQHIGEACVPCVEPGERVLAGQLVGRAEAPLCVPVHASISGTVRAVEPFRLPQGEETQAVVIESDGRMERIPTQAPQVESREEFIRAVRDSGLVGLGGAGFPAGVKLESAAGRADILLVNAAECEPYATADHREALDCAGDLLAGMRHICRWLEIKEAVIGIEGNKGDAIALLRELCARRTSPELKLRVGVLPSRYPQGAEKVFIHSLTGRVVPLGKLPPDVGVLTMNIASVAFVGRYMHTGMPLISRTVTVDGGAVPQPMNVRAPIGVSLRELCEFCGMGDIAPAKIILGGPMMGCASPGLDAIIDKRGNCVLLFNEGQAKIRPETACIRCGCCVMACPMGLQPLKLERAYLRGDAQALGALDAQGCMECGCCGYVCPAGRELAQRIRLGKLLLNSTQAKEAGA